MNRADCILSIGQELVTIVLLNTLSIAELRECHLANKLVQMLNTTMVSAASILGDIVRSLVSFPAEVDVQVVDEEHQVTLILCLDAQDTAPGRGLNEQTIRSLRIMLYGFAPRAGKPVLLRVQPTNHRSVH